MIRASQLLRPAQAGLLGLLGVLAGCDAQASGDTSSGIAFSTTQSGSLTGLINAAASAPTSVSFGGRRTIEQHVIQDDGSLVDLLYQEDVVTDGQGNFSIETVQVDSFVYPSEEVFLLIQDLRQGLYFRYRDFQPRESTLFFANYQVISSNPVTVAGRSATEILVQAVEPGSPTYLAAIDDETGIVLRAIERDLSGFLLSRMEYQTFELDPNLTGVAWYTPPQSEVALDPLQDLSAQVGFDVFEPTLVPNGYTLLKAASLVGDDGRTWVRLVYTDGVETLFLLHTGPEPTSGLSGPVGSGRGPTSGMQADAQLEKDGQVWVYQAGDISVLQGVVRGSSVIAVGKTNTEVLVDLVESSIP